MKHFLVMLAFTLTGLMTFAMPNPSATFCVNEIQGLYNESNCEVNGPSLVAKVNDLIESDFEDPQYLCTTELDGVYVFEKDLCIANGWKLFLFVNNILNKD